MKSTIRSIVAILILFNILFSAYPQEMPRIRHADKVRIQEAIQIAEIYADSVWQGFSETPFTIILITDNHEFLINHPFPSDDFKSLGQDDVLNTEVHVRPQQFNKRFLATFPAVNGVNCVVIGTPENTGLHSTQWIITLLHEHFHQYQYNSPNYHQDALSLELSGGDETGMWQLNYPFPYADTAVTSAYESYTQQLKLTVENLSDANWDKLYQTLQERRNKFKATLSEKDYKYIAFQWYQEGIARYTEYAFLELLQNYQSSEEVIALADFISYRDYLKDFYTKHLSNVINMSLSEMKRFTVYDVGFAEALIIRKKNPHWHRRYLTDKFDLEMLHK
ncbi:MAG: hypothetical protein ACRBF0_13435 [Calditrichia bacterium]